MYAGLHSRCCNAAIGGHDLCVPKSEAMRHVHSECLLCIAGQQAIQELCWQSYTSKTSSIACTDICATRQSALQLRADMSYIFPPAWLDQMHVSWHDCCWHQLAAALAAPGHPPDCPKSACMNTHMATL